MRKGKKETNRGFFHMSGARIRRFECLFLEAVIQSVATEWQR